MKLKTWIRTVSLGLLLVATGAQALSFHSDEARALNSRIKSFNYKASALDMIEEYKTLQQMYIDLNRPQIDSEELLLLKYQMISFNGWFSNFLVQKLLKGKLLDKTARQAVFGQMAATISPQTAQKLGIHVNYKAPERDLGLKPLGGTRWSDFNNWKNDPEFSNYESFGEVALYHGIHLETGDVIVSDLNSLTYASSGAMRAPVQDSMHSALFVMMHVGKRLVPTVFDVHQNGLRASPLASYMSHEVANYLEVYRGVEAEKQGWEERAQWQNSMRNAMVDAMARKEIFAFDFETKDQDRTAYICTELVEEMHLRAHSGIAPFVRKTTTEEKAYRNLRLLGDIQQAYLSPHDFAINGQFKMVGFIDNLETRAEILGWLGGDLLGTKMSSGVLNIPRLTKISSQNIKGIREIRRRSFIGKIFAQLGGLSIDSFPVGSPLLIATSVWVDKQMTASIKRCLDDSQDGCTTYFNNYFSKQDPRSFDIYDFVGDPNVRSQMNAKFRFLGDMFQ